MIDHFEAELCGCLKSVKCDLTPIHAFIGPNDSGKTTLLKAICEAVNVAARKPFVRPPQTDATRLSIRANGVELVLGSARSSLNDKVQLYELGDKNQFANVPAQFPGFTSEAWKNFEKYVGGGGWIARFDGDALRQPSALMPPEQVPNFFAQRGRGLPGIYDLILGRADGSFDKIQKCFRQLFPSVKRLGLLAVSSSEKTLQIDLLDGTQVVSNGFSEGMLYYLAYAAIEHLRRPALIAIEEPENGLHPARIAEVMRILREISSQGTQILIATHSPLVVNELKPEEISVVTRNPETGTKVTPLKDTPNFAERSKVYAPGELWLSYADGMEEAPLLGGESPMAVSKP